MLWERIKKWYYFIVMHTYALATCLRAAMRSFKEVYSLIMYGRF